MPAPKVAESISDDFAGGVQTGGYTLPPQPEGAPIQRTDAPEIYFSRSAALIVNVSKGRRISENGESKIVDQKVAEFSPLGDGFGRLITRDPEVIALLEKRILDQGQNSDVFKAAEYSRRTTPPEVRIKLLEEEHQRTLTENNRLLQQIRDKEAAASKK
jgi:hypothetical protein